ncbi:hypothetical protein LUZ61_018407 [Rhynchospora tenuis]|uniref:At3g05675-like ankyrin-like domain-containing protein n=1 Tax=Rhynchospora tenuis TaxID=198213 RepID=A0AAD5Z993_9POAL|nr:hypothetical protein LUZ61_018407 [Rhynchospora tenuis]
MEKRDYMKSSTSTMPMAMDRRLIIMPRPTSSMLSSIFTSSLNKASKMLISVATSEDVTPEEGETWRAMDHVRHVLLLTIWANVWVLRTLTNKFPSPKSNSGLFGFNVEALMSPKEKDSSSAIVVHPSQGGRTEMDLFTANSTAIGRTLSHVLETLNEIPATSRKYEYVLATADRILSENIQHGHPSLLQVSRSSLGAAFSRTSDLLRRSLRSPDRSIFTSSSGDWHSKVLHLLPPGPRRLYEGFRLCLNGFLPSVEANNWQRSYKPQRHATITGPGVGAFEWAESEKLAHELLWITKKLCDCSGASEAIVRWAFASGLSSLVLTAHPRVQAPIVKITVILIRELEHGKWYTAREVQFGILALWLPVLCYASNGVTSPAVAGPERYETEKALEDLIGDLPSEDQEIILQNWLEDFAASESDWPNLSSCFDRFCRVSRKQVLLLEEN